MDPKLAWRQACDISALPTAWNGAAAVWFCMSGSPARAVGRRAQHEVFQNGKGVRFRLFCFPREGKGCGNLKRSGWIASACVPSAASLQAFCTRLWFLCQKKPKFAILFLADKKRTQYKMCKYFWLEHFGWLWVQGEHLSLQWDVCRKGPQEEGCFEGTV